MYKNLSRYIERLHAEGSIAVIDAWADPDLEIAEITERVSKSGRDSRALLFTNNGTAFPVLTNMMGSDRHIAMALGVDDLDELGKRIEKLFAEFSAPKRSVFDKLRMLPLIGQVSRWMPRNVSRQGECQEIVMSKPDLSKLPILKCRKYDGGRFITLPLVHTEDPATGIRNVGMYRMQVFSNDTTGMHWHMHKTGARHYDEYKRLGRRMPVTVCLGGDPAYTYAATAPLPDNMDEYLLAGFIRRKPVELVKCLTNDLRVPADCDFVIEGYVDPAEAKVVEGPFGDHTGFYSLEDFYPVFHITCITHRREAIYPATVVGIPPQEDAYIAQATEKIFLAPIRLAMQNEITDLYMPVEGTAHNIAIVEIEKRYPAQALKVASSMWGAGQMMFNKFMVVASAGADVRNASALRQLADNVSIPRDIMFSRGTLDILDHTADSCGTGGKMCIDATEKLPEEGGNPAPVKVSIPAEWTLNPEILRINDSYAADWKTLFAAAAKDCADCAGAAGELLRSNNARGIKFVIVFDDNVPLGDAAMLVWYAAANCDAVRDVTVSGSMLIFDARVKLGRAKGFDRPWPNVVTTDAATISAVDSRWESFGLGEFVPSPSLKYLSLVIGEGAEIK